MKQANTTLKSYTISWTKDGSGDKYYTDTPKTLNQIIEDLNSEDYSRKYNNFRGWHPSVFTFDEIEILKENKVFKEDYGYGIIENSLGVGNCLIDIETNDLYNVYRLGIFDIMQQNIECVVVRKYLGENGIPLYNGFSSELYVIPVDRVRFVSDRDLNKWEYPFKTDLNDSYLTY